MSFDAVMTFMVVFVVIMAFVYCWLNVVKVFGMSADMDRQRDYGFGRAEWGPQGIGKTFRSVTTYADVASVLNARWSYVSAYNEHEDVYFDDPADAYEYCVAAVKEHNRIIDRLENSVYKGMPANYEWLWIDKHYQREYWLSNLNEFKEECCGQV